MSAMLDFDNACPQSQGVPSEEEFNNWISLVLSDDTVATDKKPFLVGIKIVDELESAQLNKQYRHKDYSTNVLSFTNELPKNILDSLDEIPLGDLAICAPVVEREANEQNKTLQAHWAHMVIHGVLHLQGFDHEHENEAEEMETLERKLLAKLGLADPYIDTPLAS